MLKGSVTPFGLLFLREKQLLMKVHSFTFIPTFCLGRVAETAVLKGFEIPHGLKVTSLYKGQAPMLIPSCGLQEGMKYPLHMKQL